MSIQESPVNGKNSQWFTPWLANYPSAKHFATNFVVPPVAAATAIVIPYCFFERKSYFQTDQVPPRFKFFKAMKGESSPMKAMKGGVGAMPSIVMVVGVPVVAQEKVENFVKRYWPFENKDNKSTTAQMVLSAAAVGGLSVVPLAYFNGRTNNMTLKESWKNLTWKHSVAIVSRETSCLVAWRIAGPLSDYMKGISNGSQAVEWGTVFMTGAIGSLVGHPGDTVLSRLQKQLPLEDPRQLYRAPAGAERKAAAKRLFRQMYLGAGSRAFGLSVFTCFYTMNKKELNSLL